MTKPCGDFDNWRLVKIEVVAKLFDLPLATAARKLKICSTTLKKICRNHGIPAWPYRILTSKKYRSKNIKTKKFCPKVCRFS